MKTPNISTRRLVFYAALAIAFGATMWYCYDIVAYILTAWVLSLLGRPIFNIYRKIGFGQYRIGNAPAAALTLLTFAVVIAGIASLFVPMLLDQAHNLSEVNYVRLGKTLQDPIDQTAQTLRYWGWIPRGRTSALNSLQQKIIGEFEPSQLPVMVGNILGTASEFFIGLSIVIFILFFFLKDDRLFVNAIRAVVPESQEEKIELIVSDTSKMLTRYVTGLLIQLTVFAAGISLALTFLGVPNALLIGFLAGLFNLVPYVGPIVAAGLGVLLTISSNLDLKFYGEMLPLITKVLVAFSCTQFLDNFILHPLIFSNSVKAHPLEVFIAVLLGAKLGGAAGMVLATPLYTVGKIILRAFFREYKFVQFLTGSMDAPLPEVIQTNDAQDSITTAELN